MYQDGIKKDDSVEALRQIILASLEHERHLGSAPRRRPAKYTIATSSADRVGLVTTQS
jgi:hypothetical protein